MDDQDLAPSLRWIGAHELRLLVSMEDAINAVGSAMMALSRGDALAPQRWTMPLSASSRMGLMPGALPFEGRFGVKVLSLFPASQRGSLPSHQGVMLLFDAADGRALCAIDAAALTALRTAAASAVATRALARPDAETLAIIGCGDQAAPHIAAMSCVRPIRQVFLWNRHREKAERLRASLDGEVKAVVVDQVGDAVRDADVVCTLTSSPEPVLLGKQLSPGQHVNLVGSSVEGPREVDDDAVRRSRYFVDHREHASEQAAEWRSAMRNDLVDEGHLLGEIGEVLLGQLQSRLSTSDLTMYKSLGHVVQDLAVANLASGQAI